VRVPFQPEGGAYGGQIQHPDHDDSGHDHE
jgi:hypothetical protein